MEFSEDQFIQIYAKKCGHCSPNMLFSYEYEFTCFSCGDNVIKRKRQLSEISRKKINFINRLKYAEHEIFYVFTDVYKTYEAEDFDKIYKALSKIKNKKCKINNNLVKKYEDLDLIRDFEQKYYSKTATGRYEIGYDSVRLMKWLAYFDRFF